MVDDLSERLARYLAPGETFAWTGNPGRGLALPPGLVVGGQTAGTLGIIATLALFPMILTVAGKGTGEIQATMLGLVFLWMAVVAAAYLVLDMLRRRNTAYAITDRRALILSRTFTGWKLQTWPLDALPGLELHEGWRSSIWFEREVSGGWFSQRRVTQSGFEMIPDAPKVHQLLLQHQRGAA